MPTKKAPRKAGKISRPRPYFLPESIDFDALPAAVQAAYESIIQPVYEELVLQPNTGLERAAGTTIVFLLVQELLDQFELGQALNLQQPATADDIGGREKALQRHLRLVAAKQTAISALLRLRKLGRQPQFIPVGPPML